MSDAKRLKRELLTLQNAVAELSLDPLGGSVSAFRFRGELNPLSWDSAVHDGVEKVRPRPLGHFLCLDRWGPPSLEEEKNGMPYHGEAAQVAWAASDPDPAAAGPLVLEAALPMAGLEVRRTVRLLAPKGTESAVASFRDEVRNVNALGRILNMVQHPSIAPPFLTAETRVDCNGRRGFTQRERGCWEAVWEDGSVQFPVARTQAGEKDARCMTGGDDDVFSYEVKPEDPHGWVCAYTPSEGLLVGYVWPREDYPWVSLWCSGPASSPRARGLEFGTTGLHQPFPILSRHPRIFELPTFQHLDAQEASARSFCAFLRKVPQDFKGVHNVEVSGCTLEILEKDSQRRFSVTSEAELFQK
ncbi:unnamed protein product [Effrenium voratum]|uniref:Uncharacterized protein n=1 Tax=Effrenium voratum TaxID=2562239 RepID=A0AA36I4D9_9DINO|nr:unnamed protein product [Effrenium voratum]CAJ1453518.1 unnamed protein product [Effrenium voratum]